MEKEISLKDLQSLDPTEGSFDDDLGIIARAYRKRRGAVGSGEGGPTTEEALQTYTLVDRKTSEPVMEVDCSCVERALEAFINPGWDKGDLMELMKRHSITCSNELEEALTMLQRIKMRSAMRRNKSKIQAGIRRSRLRKPTREVFKKRSVRAARALIAKRLSGGRDKSELSYGERARVEKLMKDKKLSIQRLAARLLPDVIKKDQERRSAAANPDKP